MYVVAVLPSFPALSSLTHSTSSLQQGLTCSLFRHKHKPLGHSRINMATFRTSKKKSYLTYGRKEKRRSERKRWNLEDGIAMQVRNVLTVLILKWALNLEPDYIYPIRNH